MSTSNIPSSAASSNSSSPKAGPLPATMRAMVLEVPHQPLVLKTLPVPTPSTQEVLVKIIACGICRTDLHVVDGELPRPRLPLVPGHEIVGQVVRVGSEVTTLQP